MRPTVKKALSAAVLVLAATTMLSGCIVCVDEWWCDEHRSRPATLHVYVYDYFTGAPIPWAVVELYESDWWSWDYVGSWQVNHAGYVWLRAGRLDYDGHGGAESEDFRVVVYASGYYSEDYEIELSYYYPSETLRFYLAPIYGQARVEPGDVDIKVQIDGPAELNEPPEGERPSGRVIVGGSEDRVDESEGGVGESQ